MVVSYDLRHGQHFLVTISSVSLSEEYECVKSTISVSRRYNMEFILRSFASGEIIAVYITYN